MLIRKGLGTKTDLKFNYGKLWILMILMILMILRF